MDIIEEACEVFSKIFGHECKAKAFAPGRINLIGEHTDYNDGFVFPMALPMGTAVVGSQNASQKCNIYSVTKSDSGILTFDLPTKEKRLHPGEPKWINYVKGVIENFHSAIDVGFDAVIHSSVPLGSGLSSSAALEVAFYTFLEALTETQCKNFQDKLYACQKAEHDFAGVPCGIMDQYISIKASEGNAYFIDCRDLSGRSVPVNDPSLVILISNSNVKHSLVDSEYATRRQQCYEAAQILNVASLRDAAMQHLIDHKHLIPELTFKRAQHVISENERTSSAMKCLQDKDFEAFGKLMTQSHESLRDDYEVSCSELDELVSIALKCDGVLGARMTGGGFGGCTITLVSKDKVEVLKQQIDTYYTGKASFYVCTPAEGARIIQ